MDRYTPRGRRIFGGIFLLALAGFAVWFIVQGFIIFTPFAKNYSVRDIGGYYVEGRVTEIISAPEERGGVVLHVEAEYRIGFQRVQSRLPAQYFYYEGLEVGDRIAVPYSQKDFDDMRREDKIVLTVSIIAFVIFFIWGICVLAGEIAAARYFRRLVLNKTYINARFQSSEIGCGRIRAVCTYCSHVFKSRWYSKERYPFKEGGEIRVYVDLLKNPHKYLVSEF